MTFGQIYYEKCNVDTVLKIQKSGENIETDLILKFLCSIDEVCSNSVEFSELSNETLFNLIMLVPNKFLKVLNYKDVNSNHILSILKSPIHDNIDLQKCYDNISSLDNSIPLRKEVLNSIDAASKKLNVQLSSKKY